MDMEHNPSVSFVLKSGEKHRESIGATPGVENDFNLIKEEPEMDDYEIENCPLEVAENVCALDCIKQEPELIIPSSNKVVEQRRNRIIDHLNHPPDSALNDSVALIKKEPNEALNESEQVHDIDFKDWTIYNEELNIKEDVDENEASVVEPRAKHATQTNTLNFVIRKENFEKDDVPSDLSTFRNDYLTKDGDRKFKCNDCDYWSRQKCNLNRHMLLHMNPDEVKTFKCGQCKFETIRKRSLKVHLLQHVNSDDVNKYNCNECNYETLYKGSLKAHMMRHINSKDVKKFKCSDCDYRTFRKCHLKSHMLLHMNPDEVKKFKCGQCKFETIRKGSLKLHLLRHVESEAIKSCI